MSAALAGPPLLLRRVVAENAVILVVMVAYLVATAIMATAYRFAFSLTLYAPLWAVMAGGVGIYAVLRPLAPKGWRLGERLAMAAPILILAPAFFSAFTSVKSAIATIHPYAWDVRLTAADHWLLGGDAWRVLKPLLNHPPVTFTLSLLYSSWHLALIGVFGVLAMSLARADLRRQALTALMLCWGLLGTWAAIAFSSVGPCFADLFGAGAPGAFAEQAAYLQAANSSLPIFEFAEQHRLLEASSVGRPILGSGISAMPSMHVAIATLMALIGWRTARWAGALGTAYLAVVIVASIHLGWHYAWDSIAAVTGAAVIWLASGWIAAPWEHRAAV